jgi:MscS family membrane protein
MNPLLHKIILDNSILSYLLCLGTILLVFLIKRYVSKYIAGLFFRLFQKASWNIDKKDFVNLMVQPLGSFVFMLVTIAALDKLTFPAVLDFDIFHITSRRIVASLGTALIIIFFIWLLLRIIDFVALLLRQRAGSINESAHAHIIVFFGDFFKIILAIAGILLIIQFAFHKDISAWLGGVGIATAAIALAAKESIENLIASFIIFFNKPFHLGDLIKVNGVTGNIEKIGLRSTRIRTDQKTYVTIPNKQMVDSIVDNLTLRTQRRGDIKLDISPATSSNQLKQLIEELNKVIEQPQIKNKLVLLGEIVTNAYIIYIEYYTNPIPIAEFNELKQRINIDTIKVMEALKIELAGLNTEIKISGSLSPEI